MNPGSKPMGKSFVGLLPERSGRHGVSESPYIDVSTRAPKILFNVSQLLVSLQSLVGCWLVLFPAAIEIDGDRGREDVNISKLGAEGIWSMRRRGSYPMQD